MDPTEKDTTPVTDDNLSELLDSCIEDFNKPLPPTQPKTVAKSPLTPSIVGNPAEEASADAWSSEFKNFSSVMENLMGNKGDMEEIQKLMEGCMSQNMDNLPDEEAFTSSLADTIRQLTEQAQNVPEPSPGELANLLENLDVQGAVGDLEGMPELMPLMQGVMQKLMSKELLYPSIKEIVDKYPAWLTENKASLDPSEYAKYESQFALMKEICTEFESEDQAGTDDEKNRQFERVLQLMQRIQAFGNPPKELVSNIGPGIPIDDQGNLQIPGMPNNCVVM